MIATLLALQLLAGVVPVGSAAGSRPPEVRDVQIVSLVGLPADSSFTHEFAEAFRAALAAPDLATERAGADGAWTAADSVANRFRFMDEDGGDETWKLEVSIGAPLPAVGKRRGLVQDPNGGVRPGWVKTVAPKFRSSRGMIVGLTLTIPDASGRPAEPKSLRSAFYFPATVTDPASPAVPSAYRYPWGTAGRAAALLVLDALHHEAGDLAAAVRMDLAPAVRIEPGAERGANP